MDYMCGYELAWSLGVVFVIFDFSSRGSVWYSDAFGVIMVRIAELLPSTSFSMFTLGFGPCLAIEDMPGRFQVARRFLNNLL